MNHEIVGPEQKNIGRTEAMEMAMPGQLRIPKDIAIAKHIAQFWSPGMDAPRRKPLTEKEMIILDKKNEIWRAERERKESRTGIVQMEQAAKLLAEGGRVPVVQRAKWLWKKDRAIQVDQDGNLYEMRPIEHVKPTGSSEWQIVKKV